MIATPNYSPNYSVVMNSLNTGKLPVIVHCQLNEIKFGRSFRRTNIYKRHPEFFNLIELSELYGFTDETHHKQYAIDQFLRTLLKEQYAVWRNSCANWDEGIAA